MSFGQKIKVFFVSLVLKFFHALEWGDFFTKNLLRLVLFSILLATFFLGFYFESKETQFYRYVPGAATFKLSTRARIPVLIKDIPLPETSAKAALVTETNSNRKLFELDPYTRYPLASTTKLMTAIISLGLYASEELLVTPDFCAGIEGSRLGLMAGESMRVDDLLLALLINSSNDAACVLASGKTSIADFVSLMNAKAQDFGLENTLFDNPVGLDSVNNSNYSSAYDLYLLAKEAMKIDTIKNIVKMDEATLKTGIAPRKISTTNLLLWAIPESYGIKTGKTLAAGEVLIYGYRKGEKDLIIVVMGSDERFIDTRSLLNWTLDSYIWQ